MSAKSPRSPEARKRRADKFRAMTAGGRRIVCEVCNELHPAPECLTAERVRMTIDLPSWLHQSLRERVEWGERSPWVVRLIRRELDV